MFESLLEKIASELDKSGIPYMVIGGQAVLLYGEPRLTRDIDITLGISVEMLDEMLLVAETIGLKPLVDPRTFTLKTMVLPCSARETDLRVDFIFSFSPYERQAMERARIVRIRETGVKFASAEDLVIHKIFAGRPRDLEDAKGVLLKNTEIDHAYIRHWLNELSIATAESFLDRFEALVEDIL